MFFLKMLADGYDDGEKSETYIILLLNFGK